VSKISNSETILLQKKLALEVITKNILPKKIKLVCGVDVSYRNDFAYCSAVIIDKKSHEYNWIKKHQTEEYYKIHSWTIHAKRIKKPILHTLKKLEKSFDILLVDGNGQLHPRQCGLACYIGLKLDKPVIGVAKSLLCGKVKSDSKVEYRGKVLGYEIKQNKKKIYVSVGHKINLKTAVKIIKELTVKGNWYPEPLRLADFNSKHIAKSWNKIRPAFY